MATNYNTYQYVESDMEFVFKSLDNNRIGCYFCKCPLLNRCYAFAQSREDWDRDIMLMACHDQCPIAMIDRVVSKCRICHREYLHMRYDNEICINCEHVNININNNNNIVHNPRH